MEGKSFAKWRATPSAASASSMSRKTTPGAHKHMTWRSCWPEGYSSRTFETTMLGCCTAASVNFSFTSALGHIRMDFISSILRTGCANGNVLQYNFEESFRTENFGNDPERSPGISVTLSAFTSLV